MSLRLDNVRTNPLHAEGQVLPAGTRLIANPIPGVDNFVATLRFSGRQYGINITLNEGSESMDSEHACACMV